MKFLLHTHYLLKICSRQATSIIDLNLPLPNHSKDATTTTKLSCIIDIMNRRVESPGVSNSQPNFRTFPVAGTEGEFSLPQLNSYNMIQSVCAHVRRSSPSPGDSNGNQFGTDANTENKQNRNIFKGSYMQVHSLHYNIIFATNLHNFLTFTD